MKLFLNSEFPIFLSLYLRVAHSWRDRDNKASIKTNIFLARKSKELGVTLLIATEK